MKTSLIFLACLAPLAGGLWLLGADDARPDHLPAESPADGAGGVLDGTDFAAVDEPAAFPGRVQRLSDITVRVLAEGYVQYYLRVERLARDSGAPRLDDVTCAVYEPPRDGAPQLRLTFHAPAVHGDPYVLLRGPKDEPRIAELRGGVVVRDPAGRTLAEIASLAIDLTAHTVRSGDAVTLDWPDRGAHLSGVGLEGDVDMRRVTILGEVRATVAQGDSTIAVSCVGPATAEENGDGAVRVAFDGFVTLEHPLGLLTCRRAEAWIRRRGDRHELQHAILDGDVRIELRDGSAAGLESVSARQVVFRGENRIVCHGPVRGAWRGPLKEFGVGERVLDVDAAGATLHVRRAGKAFALVEAAFETVRAVDRDGAGHVAADGLRYLVEGPRIEARGHVEARTPDGLLEAGQVDVARTGQEAFRIEVRDVRRMEYVVDGKLGPLGEAKRGRLHVTCRDRILVTGTGETTDVAARGQVVAFVDEQTRIEAGAVRLVIEDGTLASFRGDRRVRLQGRGAVLSGRSIVYDGVVATARIAVLREGDRTVEAKTLVYREEKTFDARGAVRVVASLGAGPWTVRCNEARGSLGADGKPSEVEASGAIRATGPEGEEIEGERFRYDAGARTATLDGAPARVRRGTDLLLEASEGFALRLEKGAVAEARTRGRGRLEVRGEAAGARGIAAWRADLDGPVEMRGDTSVLVPGGARMRAVDAAGKTVLTAAAGRIRVDLERDAQAVRPVRVTGDRGVAVEDGARTKVTARRLVYAPGARRVDVYGDARVDAPGWPREVRFRHVVFVVKESGIDLKRASDVEVVEKE